MWIRNKGTNSIQEIHNEDVIKLCKKEPEKYELSEEMFLSEENTVKVTKETTKEALPEKENMAEKKEDQAQTEAETLREEGTGEITESNKHNNDLAANLSAKSVADLRVIAKEKGIQGYGNMNKETLLAVIAVH